MTAKDKDLAVRALRVVVAHLSIASVLLVGKPKLENAALQLMDGAAALLTEVEVGEG